MKWKITTSYFTDPASNYCSFSNGVGGCFGLTISGAPDAIKVQEAVLSLLNGDNAPEAKGTGKEWAWNAADDCLTEFENKKGDAYASTLAAIIRKHAPRENSQFEDLHDLYLKAKQASESLKRENDALYTRIKRMKELAAEVKFDADKITLI